MKIKFSYIFCIIFFFGFIRLSHATHIVGGEIYYDNLGGNNYKIHMKVYRDCYNGIPPLDSPAFVTIFDAGGNVFTTLSLPLLSSTLVPPAINSSCIQAPNTVCVEEGIYETTINLPPLAGGYYIVYQRCCRNGTILNLVNPGGVGTTYWEHIPGPEVVLVNSSPRFKLRPNIFVCNGLQIAFDHSAIDPDGDQLVYSLGSPFNGLDGCCPTVGSSPSAGPQCPVPPAACPSVNTPPPYFSVPFLPPYSSVYPMSSSPAININPVTGFLNGIPNIDGQWVVGVCVKEYRAGILIGTHYRDFQFNVVTCSVTVISAMLDQIQPCSGYTVNFSNQSFGGTVYHWDFGVPSLTNDTSNLTNPIYVYPDSGKYTVTLIANPGKPCSDTSTKTFFIYPLLAPTFTAPPGQCITGNSFNFTVGGSYAPYSTFSWTFGGAAATPSTSTIKNPTGITYSLPGKYPIKVTVKESVCSVIKIDTVIVNKKPNANFDPTLLKLCDPASVTFTNTSATDVPTTYFWQYSDGGTSTLMNPTHVFTPPGVYNVTLTIITNSGCIDTSKFVVNGYVTVNPIPRAGFSFLPTETTIFDPDIYFFDESVGATTWFYTFGDNDTSSMVNPSHHYNNYGDFTVVQTVTNGFGCPDTAVRIVHILPEFRFWIPNCFTPGKQDGLNDIFKPVLIGVKEYEFYIYDRWGECIYHTNDTEGGWDGYYGGHICQQDVYVWLINFKNVVSLRHEQHYGHVTLLK